MKRYLVLFFKGGFPVVDTYATACSADEAVREAWSTAEFWGIGECDEIRVFELAGKCESYSVPRQLKKYSYDF